MPLQSMSMKAYTCSAVQHMATSILKWPMMSQQYVIYTTSATSSSLKAVRVLPVPDTAMNDGCRKRQYMTHVLQAGVCRTVVRRMDSGSRQESLQEADSRIRQRMAREQES